MADFDLDAYFARIGYGGATKPNLETLIAIHAAQVDSIPFENLDPLLGRPVKLDLDSLQAKLVASRRGGYCFELNGLFKAALDALGYSVTGLAGRVRWMSPADAPLGGRSHMLMRVDLPDGPYLADAGFGAHLLDAPLKLRPGPDQSTPWAAYRPPRPPAPSPWLPAWPTSGAQPTFSASSRSWPPTTRPTAGSPPPTRSRCSSAT
jgi:N-hydroxyarylamine O-acetyltransferase